MEKWKLGLVLREIGAFLLVERWLRQSELGKYAVDIRCSLPRLATYDSQPLKGLDHEDFWIPLSPRSRWCHGGAHEHAGFCRPPSWTS